MPSKDTTLSASITSNQADKYNDSSVETAANLNFYTGGTTIAAKKNSITAKMRFSVEYNSTNRRYDVTVRLFLKKENNNNAAVNIKFNRYINTPGDFSGFSAPKLPNGDEIPLSGLSSISYTEVARWEGAYANTSSVSASSIKEFTASLYINFGLYGDSGFRTADSTTSMAITNKISLRANGSAVQRTISFAKGDYGLSVSPTSKKGYDGEGFSLGEISVTTKSRQKLNTTTQYTISYEGLTTTSSTTVKYYYENYSHSGWSSKNQGSKSVSATYIINGNDTVTATFSTTTTSEGSCEIKSLTTSKPTKKGYISDGTWHYNSSTGRTASVGDVVTSDTKLYSGWTPKNYSVKFDSNKGPKTGIPAQVTKTYGSAVYIQPWSPDRFGYKFIGWSGAADSKSILIGPGGGSYNSDALYNNVNTETSNNGITLYAQWEPINNTLEFNYYINSTTTVQKETLTYNIESTEVSKNAPSKPFIAGNDDHVFIGWTTVKPVNFNSVSKGVYPQGTDFPDTILPVKVTQADIKKVTEWGKTTTYYGIWSISGKYVFMGGQFRKCNSCWVKTKEPNEAFPTWKVVNNVLVKKTIGTRTKWWPEVGRNS